MFPAQLLILLWFFPALFFPLSRASSLGVRSIIKLLRFFLLVRLSGFSSLPRLSLLPACECVCVGGGREGRRRGGGERGEGRHLNVCTSNKYFVFTHTHTHTHTHARTHARTRTCTHTRTRTRTAHTHLPAPPTVVHHYSATWHAAVPFLQLPSPSLQ